MLGDLVVSHKPYDVNFFCIIASHEHHTTQSESKDTLYGICILKHVSALIFVSIFTSGCVLKTKK